MCTRADVSLCNSVISSQNIEHNPRRIKVHFPRQFGRDFTPCTNALCASIHRTLETPFAAKRLSLSTMILVKVEFPGCGVRPFAARLCQYQRTRHRARKLT